MDKLYKSLLFTTNRLVAMKFAEMLGCPFPLIKDMMLSKEWREAHNKIIEEQLKKVHTKKGK